MPSVKCSQNLKTKTFKIKICIPNIVQPNHILSASDYCNHKVVVPGLVDSRMGCLVWHHLRSRNDTFRSDRLRCYVGNRCRLQWWDRIDQHGHCIRIGHSHHRSDDGRSRVRMAKNYYNDQVGMQKLGNRKQEVYGSHRGRLKPSVFVRGRPKPYGSF